MSALEQFKGADLGEREGDAREVIERKRLIRVALAVRAFMQGEAGLYLAERCAEERADALMALAQVTPTDAEAIRALQSVVARCDSFEQWLDDAVALGEAASADDEPAPE